jgi:hypothetical protein
MLTSLGVAALFGIVGTFAAVLWTFVLKLAALPGAALAKAGTRQDKPGLVRAGVGLTFVVEAYLLLAFGGLVVRAMLGFLDPRAGIPPWPLWLAGCYLATAPVLFGGRDTPGATARDATDRTFRLALPLAVLGYWAFVISPDLLEWGWGWLPRLRF